MGRCIYPLASRSLSLKQSKRLKTTQNLSQQYSFFCGDLPASSSIFPRRVIDICEKTGKQDRQTDFIMDTSLSNSPYYRNGQDVGATTAQM